MAGQLYRGSWEELNGTRSGGNATMYFENAGMDAQPQAVTGNEAVMVTVSDRIKRLIELDKVYRTQGWQAWLSAAGVTCTAVVEARQPEEETVVASDGNHIVVSGLQVRGNCSTPYPTGFTSDRPNEVTTISETRQYQPDLRNASVVYTDASFEGQATVWVDLTNWDQLVPPGMVPPPVVATAIPPQELDIDRDGILIPTVNRTQTIGRKGLQNCANYVRADNHQDLKTAREKGRRNLPDHELPPEYGTQCVKKRTKREGEKRQTIIVCYLSSTNRRNVRQRSH